MSSWLQFSRVFALLSNTTLLVCIVISLFKLEAPGAPCVLGQGQELDNRQVPVGDGSLCVLLPLCSLNAVLLGMETAVGRGLMAPQ